MASNITSRAMGEPKQRRALAEHIIKKATNQYCVQAVTSRPLIDANSGPALLKEWKTDVEQGLRRDLTEVIKNGGPFYTNMIQHPYIDPNASAKWWMASCQRLIDWSVVWAHMLLDKFYATQIEMVAGDKMGITMADGAAGEVENGTINYEMQDVVALFGKFTREDELMAALTPPY